MQEAKNSKRNYSIDIFRYICSIMVMAIHTCPFKDVNSQLGYTFTQIIPRIAVPFFFAVSGYFYVQKLEKNEKVFLPYLKRLITSYFIWSCIYYIVEFFMYGYLHPIKFLNNCIYKFAISGSWYHLWFFPALIFSVCITTLIFKIKCKKSLFPISIILYVIGCFGCSYHTLGIQIPILAKLFKLSQFDLIRRILLMGFPFFISGYFVYKIKNEFNVTLINKKLFAIWFMSIVLWLVEIGIVRELKLEINIFITLGLYLLVIVTLLILVINPLNKYSSLSNKCRVLANFTYYSHPLFIIGLSSLDKYFLHIGITNTPMFLLAIVITYIFGSIIYKLDNKYINQIVK